MLPFRNQKMEVKMAPTQVRANIVLTLWAANLVLAPSLCLVPQVHNEWSMSTELGISPVHSNPQANKQMGIKMVPILHLKE